MLKFSPYAVLLAFTLTVAAVDLFAYDPAVWRPVTPAELTMDKPQVDPDADAEAIFWEVRLDDKKRKNLSYEHYVRVKIFTERGQERFSKFDIPYFKGKKVEDVAARVIKPDGSVIELRPQDIFEREIVRQRKIKILAKSFAVPGIAPGVIVEYQYREVFKNDSADGERLYFQHDIPIQRVSYYVRPYKNMSLEFKPRNMNLTGIRQMDDGFFVASMNNVPAYKEEPRMPPDEETRQWAYLSYNSRGRGLNWSILILGASQYFDAATAPDEPIREKARQLTNGVSGDREKLKKLYEFVQNQIKNVSFESSGSSNIKIKRTSDVLKYGAGDAQHIDLLFASLARALGFEVNLVLAGDRRTNFFDPNRDPVNVNYIHPACISVMLDQQPNYYNPGTPYLPFGELIWFEENVQSVHLNADRSFWQTTPLTGHENSKGIRKGKFTLTENGVLEGEVSVEYTGNWAVDRRGAAIGDSTDKRVEEFEEELKEWISTGEFSDVRIENVERSDRTLTYSYRLRIPDYATQTGKRMFFQPGVFQSNSKAEFSSSTRTHPIYFRYPWSEADEVEIKLPAGFTLENFNAPTNVNEKSKLGGLQFDVDFDSVNNTLKFKRRYFFGGGNRILFPAKSYESLKNLFDLFHQSDTYTLSLVRN
jgi:transglutaminase-like putative cysteine protease